MAVPKVSVVLAAYNLEKYLGECLDSIRAQTFENFECIIVDDGSTDRTSRIATHYSKLDKRFRAIKKQHGGVSTARNAGFDQVKAQYVMFLDGDDFFSPKLLEALYGKIHRSSSDIAVCNYATYYDSMKKYGPPRIDFRSIKNRVFSHRDETDTIFDICTLMFWNKMFRVEFLKNHSIRNDESLHRAQDIEFVGRALVAAKSITFTKQSLVFYRTDTGSSNVKRLHEHPFDVIRALEKLKEYLDAKAEYKLVEKSFTKITVDHILANLYFTEMQSIHHKVFDKARRFITDAQLHIPDESYTSDKKSYNEIQTFLTSNYEEWLRFRINNLRDDEESKYISYLLGEFQRKYKDEVNHNNELQSSYDKISNSLSWKVTKPLRIANALRKNIMKNGV